MSLIELGDEALPEEQNPTIKAELGEEAVQLARALDERRLALEEEAWETEMEKVLAEEMELAADASSSVGNDGKTLVQELVQAGVQHDRLEETTMGLADLRLVSGCSQS